MAIYGAVPGPGFGGSTPAAPMPGQSAGEASGLRLAAPIFRVARDAVNISNPYGWSLFRIGNGFGGYASYRAYSSRYMGGFGGWGSRYAGGYAGGYGGFGSRLGGGYMYGGSSVGAAFTALPGLLAKNALLAGLMSLISNGIELARGRVDSGQFLAHTVADTAAYTGIGVSATLIGGMIGSVVPGIGTIVGIGVGLAISFFLGKAYEEQLRPSFTHTVAAKLLNTSAPGMQPTS